MVSTMNARRTSRVGARMRSLAVAIAAFAWSTAAARALDTYPIGGQLPDDADSKQVYLFQLKKNGISLKLSPDDFCTTMHYGKAVQGHGAVDLVDGKSTAGELDWVICRFERQK
jgi:hypothetical protein